MYVSMISIFHFFNKLLLFIIDTGKARLVIKSLMMKLLLLIRKTMMLMLMMMMMMMMIKY